MKKLLWLIFIISGFLQAQELDTLGVEALNTDTLEIVPPPYYGAFFADLALNLSPNPAGPNLVTQWGFGIQYNKWVVGFSQYNFEGIYQQFVIFPNVFELDYRLGGPMLGYQLTRTEWIAMLIKGSYQWGDMIWIDKDSGSDFLRDRFKMTNLSLWLEVNKIRYAKPYLIVGYQLASDLKIAQLNKRDFSGVYLGLGLRIGFFNQ